MDAYIFLLVSFCLNLIFFFHSTIDNTLVLLAHVVEQIVKLRTYITDRWITLNIITLNIISNIIQVDELEAPTMGKQGSDQL